MIFLMFLGATKDLDENGMIRIVFKIKPQDILIGELPEGESVNSEKKYYVLSLEVN
jgi:DNA-directed RNA polymerase beta subunit